MKESCRDGVDGCTDVQTQADGETGNEGEKKKLLNDGFYTSRHNCISEKGTVSALSKEADTVQSNKENGLRNEYQEASPADQTVEDGGTDGQYPIDEGWAWMIVVGCFGMHVLAVGGVKSFGILFVEFEEKYKTSSKTLAGVQAVSAFLMLGLGPISNALAARFTCRVVVMCGGFLVCMGFVCSAFIPSFEWLFLTYGLMGGIGFSLSYAPCVVMVGHHFQKRRSLANGLSVSGSGVGSFVLPILMRFLLDYYGLFGSLLIIGGLMLNICACACLFRPLSSYKRTTKHLTKNIPKANSIKKPDVMAEVSECEKLTHVAKNKILLESKRKYFSQDCAELPRLESSLEKKKHLQKCYSVENNPTPGVDSPLQHRRLRLISKSESKSETSLYASTGDLILASFQNIPETEREISVEDVSQNLCCSFFRLSKNSDPTKSSVPLFNFSLLLNPLFLIYIFSVMLANCGYPNVFMMLPSYAQTECNVDKKTAALLLSIIGLSDLVGRLFFGWFSDLKLFPRRYIFIGGMAISGLLQIIVTLVKKKEMLIFFCSSFGFFAGSYVALIAVMLVDALGVDMLSSAFGWMTLAMSVGLAGGPPLVGALRDMTNSWSLSFVVIGILTMLGSVIVLHEPLIQMCRARKEKEDQTVVSVEMTEMSAGTELLEN